MQQINLYQGSTRAPAPLFGGAHLVKASLSVIALLLVVTAISIWHTVDLRDEIAIAQVRLEVLAAETKTLAAEHSEIPLDLSLQQKLAISNRLKTTMQQLLEYLSDSRSKRAQGFSTYFEGLARRTVPNVWFSGISIEDGGVDVQLKGSTLQPKKVPQLLQLLKDEPAFRGKMFSRLAMDQPDNALGHVNFAIDTKPLEEADRGGA